MGFSLDEVDSVFLADCHHFLRWSLICGRFGRRDGIEFAKHFFSAAGKQHYQSPGSVWSGFGRMGNAAREENGAADAGGNRFIPDCEIHVALDDVEHCIFLGMKVGRDPGAGTVALLDDGKRAAGLRAIEFYDLLIANDSYMFTGLPVYKDRTEQLG